MKITKQMTVKQISCIPQLQEIAPYFVGGPVNPLTKSENIPIDQWSKMERGLGDSLVDGINRLLQVKDNAPCYNRVNDEEEPSGHPGRQHVNIVHFPPLKKELTEEEEPPFVLICAGGGFATVWSLTEGYPVAARFNEMGFHAFVLTYRTGGIGLFPKPMDDIAAALRFIKVHEKELGVNGNRYLVNGYSAGGMICAAWGTERNGYKKYGLPAPEALFPVYPVIHIGEDMKPDVSMIKTIYGEGATQEKIASYNIDTEATENYPPSYLVCCEDDNEVPYGQSILMKERLEQLGIPVMLEIGKEGCHGFGEGRGTDVEGWIERAVEFWKGL